jgi:hypothetical protein
MPGCRSVRAVLALLAVVMAAGCTIPSLHPAQPRYYAEVIGGAPWTDLVVEVDYAPGHAPGEAATTHLVDELRSVTGKTNVVLDAQQTLNDTSGKTWTAQDLIALEAATRRHPHAAPHALLHVLYVSGSYNASGDVAGVTISGPVLGPVTIFLDKLRSSSCIPTPLGGIGLPVDQPSQALDALESSTLLHEVGHAMGLVDNGLPMVKPHEDKDHPGHSPDAKSVMYWQLDTCSGLRQALLQDGSVPAAFDGDDLADMRSVGGR